MDASFTIVVEANAGPAQDAAGCDLRARRAAEFADELAKVFPGGVEEEEPGANLVQTAQDVWTFVVIHKEELKLAADLASIAGGVVTALIKFAKGSNVKVKVVDGSGREVTVEADCRADADRMVEAILRAARPPSLAG